jgi:hypothetical protein
MNLNTYNNNICLFITCYLQILIYIFIINFLLMFYNALYFYNLCSIFLIYINYNNYLILNDEYFFYKKNKYYNNKFIELSTFISWFTILFGFYNHTYLIVSAFLILTNIINFVSIN